MPVPRPEALARCPDSERNCEVSSHFPAYTDFRVPEHALQARNGSSSLLTFQLQDSRSKIRTASVTGEFLYVRPPRPGKDWNIGLGARRYVPAHLGLLAVPPDSRLALRASSRCPSTAGHGEHRLVRMCAAHIQRYTYVNHIVRADAVQLTYL